MAQQIIRSIGSDGKEVLSNILDKDTGKLIEFKEVSEYYDGTPMSDDKLDIERYLYIKNNGKYYLRVLDNPDKFLEKDTMLDMRNISNTEIMLLKMGYYKGVKLNGYYSKGDTPAPIDYYLSDTSEEDDGGSVFAVRGVKLEHEFVGEVDVLYFGAKGDLIQDDTIYIKNAINYGSQENIKIPKGSFLVTDTIQFPNTIRNLVMIGEIVADPQTVGTIIRIGEHSVRVNMSAIEVRARFLNITDWEDESKICAELINFYSCKVTIHRADNGYIGVRCLGDGSGFVYNEVYLYGLRANKISLDLITKVTDSLGWVNENNFYGGRFSRGTTTNIGKGNIGVRIISPDNGYINNNNNFYKPSFELYGEASAPERSLPILIEHGSQNKFINCRNERNGSSFAQIKNDSTENEIHTGYGFIEVEDDSLYPNGVYTSRRNIGIRTQSLVFDSGKLENKSATIGTSTYFSNLVITSNISGSILRSATNVNRELDYIDFTGTRAIGIIINTESIKRFLLKKDTLQGFGGRLLVMCYDSEGNRISGTDPKHVRGTISRAINYTDSYGGAYSEVADSTADSYFKVSDEVKSIFVGVRGGTERCRVRRFSVYSVESGAPIYSKGSHDMLDENNLYLSSPPTDLNYKVGKIIYNSNPEIGTSMGWVLTDSTWEPFGIVGNPSASTTVKGLVKQAAVSANTAEQAAGATPTKEEFDALLAELRDLKTKLRTAGTLAANTP